MTARHVLALLAGLAGAPLALAGQDTEERSRIARWRDSLQATRDTGLLRALHRETLRVADSARGDPMAELRLGLAGLRLAELTGEARLIDQAARAFTGVTEDRGQWVEGWTALAEAEMAGAPSGRSVTWELQQMLGLDPTAKIVSYLVRGMGDDTTDVDGVLRIGRRALASHEPVAGQVGLRSARMVPGRAVTRRADFGIVRARLEREVGDKDSAAAVIERVARQHPDHPGVLRAQAQIRFVVGRSDGAGPWYRGLELADSATLWRYRRDLDLVVPDSILLRLAGVRGRERTALIRSFWRSQDADGLPTEDDRLAEHYRRLEFARQHYVRLAAMRAGPYDIDTLSLAAFDARGEMLLRHGSPRVRTSIGDFDGPDVEVTLRIIGMPPNESWVYPQLDGSDLFFHFVRPTRDEEFLAVESLLDILAYSAQFRRFRPGLEGTLPGDTTRRTVLVHGGELVSLVAQELLVSRHKLSPLYSAMIDEGIGAADSIQDLERRAGRAALLKPYSYELGFELPLDGAVQVLAVGSDRGGPVVQLAFAIAGTDLTPGTMPRGVVYPVRTRLAALDADGAVITQIDTTRGFLSPVRLRPSQHLVGQLTFRLPPGTFRVRATLEHGRRGLLSPPLAVAVPALDDDVLSLSDVSIGARSVPIVWRSPGSDTAWANPLGRYRHIEEMEVYFEVGGLADGAPYRTQIALDRVEGLDATGCEGRGTALTLSFEGTGRGGLLREQRALSLDRLREGRYQLAVIISTSDGRRAIRCRTFTVVRE
jgi:hypothetical protein